jgi:acetoin utilization deacetylase AcuC-like enzyme
LKTGIVTTDSYQNHDTGPGHPERVDRVVVVNKKLNELKDKVEWIKPAKLDLNLLSLAHKKEYLDNLNKLFPKSGIQFLDGDTIVSPGSKQAAMDSVSSIITAIDQIENKKIKNAFCSTRPPGHHAESDKAMGFCIYNNVAIGAMYLLTKYKYQKVAIIDFDVHHGNGTQEIFYNNKQVLYISSHQFPFYPGTGSKSETGKYNNIFNVPLLAGSNGRDFFAAYENVYQKLREFKPEYILLSAGFDAHEDDPLAQINLTSDDFYKLTCNLRKMAKDICNGKLVSILEGGYDLDALRDSVFLHVKALMES